MTSGNGPTHELANNSDPLAAAREKLHAVATDLATGKSASPTERNRHLQRVLEVSRVMTSTLELATLLPYVTDTVIEMVEAERGFLILLGDDSEPIFKVAHDSHGQDILNPDDQVSHTIIDNVVASCCPMLVDNALQDDQFKRRSSVLLLGLSSVMCAPLMTGDTLIGVLYVENRSVAGKFNEHDRELLTIFANQAGVAIQNAKLFDELKTARDHLVLTEKLHALGQMAAEVAHDFSNVLAAIIGRLELLTMMVDDPDAKTELEATRECALQGAEVSKRIRDFTKVGSETAFTKVFVNDIVERALEMTEHAFRQAAGGQKVKVNVVRDVPPNLAVPGDAPALRQVLINMILNAVDAMPDGGSLTISAHEQDAHVCIAISDTGAGMEKAVQSKIFDPFFTTKGHEGTGLGMSMAYGVISRHDGTIDVESAPGKGTTFQILLPASEEAGQKPELPAEAAEPTQHAKVLILDDEEKIRDVLARMLEKSGHEVTRAGTGKDGIELFQKAPFDVVFTDLLMPGMSGWDIATQLKGLDSKVIVVMVTGWGVDWDSEKVQQGGVDLLLHKPIQMTELLNVVAEAMTLKDKL